MTTTYAPRTESATMASDPLSEAFRAAVTAKVREWVEVFPEPNTPIVGMAGHPGEEEKLLSPNQVLLELEHRTPIGENLMRNWMDLLVKTVKGSPLL
jgi:hypothetical protein